MSTDREKPDRRALWWLAYAGWFAMAGWLFIGGSNKAGGGLRGAEELLSSVKLDEESSWMGVYLGGKKIGYIHSTLSPLPDGGYEIVEISRMSGAMMGAQQQMRLQMNVIADSTLALVSFEGHLDASPYNTSFKGDHHDRVLHIELTTGGKATERVLAAPEPIYLSQAIKPLLGTGRLNPGDSLKLAGFDPLSLEMQDLIVFGAPLETQILFGKQVEARKLITRMGGFESTLYVDAEGYSLAEFGPLGLVLKQEDMEMALAVDDGDGAVDFLDLFAIKPTGDRIQDSREVKRARFRVIGVPIEQLVEASSRQARAGSDTVLVDYTPMRYERPGELDSSTLRDVPFIESRDPAIIEAAREAVNGGTDRGDSLERLSKWVFENVDKKPSAGIPSALAVLNTRSGDCNEHSVLFTAMARSLGIPTRIQLGVVYQSGRFYYHAWPASLVEGEWEEFEPTFGDKRADAARIALAHGDLSASGELAGVIGKIEIVIIQTFKN